MKFYTLSLLNLINRTWDSGVAFPPDRLGIVTGAFRKLVGRSLMLMVSK